MGILEDVLGTPFHGDIYAGDTMLNVNSEEYRRMNRDENKKLRAMVDNAGVSGVPSISDRIISAIARVHRSGINPSAIYLGEKELCELKDHVGKMLRFQTNSEAMSFFDCEVVEVKKASYIAVH